MRRLPVVLLVVLAFMQPSASSAAPPPPGAISSNVEFIANVPEMRTAISIDFLGHTMFVSATTGLYAYSVADPAAPSLIGALPMYIWQNEDLDIDPVRKLAIISRDPRLVPVFPSGALPYGAIHIVDISLPHAMHVVNTFPMPAGHTSTCINDCRFLWTGGPLRNSIAQPDGTWTGRPIYATDITDPLNPVHCPEPIDTGRDDGVTAYAHDVQVDEMGIAWVSGQGGVRGYWTTGEHLNPLTGNVETATGCKPIPYAGGGTPNEATPSRFMHNSWRDPDATIPGEDDPATPGDDTRGHVLYATEENLGSACATSGRFATYDLRGSYGGEGWRDISQTKFRLRVLDTWWPQGEPGGTGTGCASAHYFEDRGDGILAYGFYGQGTRFLDVSNPKDVRQIGYFRPDGSNVWGAYWHGIGEETYVFVADNARGIDILRFTGNPGDPKPPAPGPGASPSPEMSPAFGYMCPGSPQGLTVA